MDLKELALDFDLDKLTVALRGWFPSFAEKNKTLKFPGWDGVEVLGVVETLVGPNGANMPMVVAAAKSPTGQTLTERSSRVRQFKLAKDILQVAFENPLQIGIGHGVQGAVAQGLFAFYDDEGNFRLSLVHATPKGKTVEWSQIRRQSFYVDAKGENQTFRQRMGGPFGTWDQLREAFSVERLAKEFYVRLFDWYERACKDENVVFPNDVDTDGDNRQHIEKHMIRLITRLMFVWFLKQKRLVPPGLFDEAHLADILKTFKPRSKTEHNYYNAILQNLFFATLNSEITGEDCRAFAVKGVQCHGVKTLYRYADEFKISKPEVMKEFEQAPFLNGGLFECLDKMDDDNKVLYYDGFSNEDRHIYKGTLTRAHVPNYLFFDPEIGILPLFKQYNFTVTENSPRDEDVALDPELLGQVFENLLGAFNPETKVTARNMTGSFYTPREIVGYMVDESLKTMLAAKCPGAAGEPLERLFAAESERPADGKLCRELGKALTTAKYLDPACGSGAFPMGILLRVVELLRVLRGLPEDTSTYDLKLELIENCIYGIDIQTIAVQVSKLRFFISLVCEQKPTDDKENNYGIHTLPNLETKFVAADSLKGLSSRRQTSDTGKKLSKKKKEEAVPLLLVNSVEALKAKLWDVRHRHFNARTRGEKKDLRREDKKLRKELAVELQANAVFDVDDARDMANWDPYDQNLSSSFFDAEWMFNVKEGFDVIIGNPPYINVELVSKELKAYYAEHYDTFYKRFDVFGLFFEASSTRYASPTGQVAFIVPQQIANNLSYKKLRDLILKNHWLREVLYLGDKVFKAANNDVCVLFLAKAGNDSTRLVYALDFDHRQITIVPAEHFAKYGNVISFSNDKGGEEIFEKIFASGRWRIKDKFKVFQGIVTGNNPVYLPAVDEIQTAKIEPPLLKPVLHGRDFEKWAIRSAERKILYVDGDTPLDKYPHAKLWLSSFRSELKKRRECVRGVIPWYSLQWPRVKSDLDIAPKLMVQGTRNPRLSQRLVVALDKEGCYGTQGINFIVPKTSNGLEYFLLSVLNSKLLNYLYATKFLNVAIKADYLKDTPIPDASKAEEKKLSELAKQILARKEKSIVADISDLEVEIDKLVYGLYGLTTEEIAIVEGVNDPAKKPKRAKSEKPKKARGRKKVEVDLPASLPGWD